MLSIYTNSNDDRRSIIRERLKKYSGHIVRYVPKIRFSPSLAYTSLINFIHLWGDVDALVLWFPETELGNRYIHAFVTGCLCNLVKKNTDCYLVTDSLQLVDWVEAAMYTGYMNRKKVFFYHSQVYKPDKQGRIKDLTETLITPEFEAANILMSSSPEIARKTFEKLKD